MVGRPKGLTLVAVLTLLGAAGNFFFAILLIALSAVGGPPPSGYHPSIHFWILVYSPLLLSLASFIASIGMFAGARYAWYLSIILWIFSAIYYIYIAFVLFRGMSLGAVIGLTSLVNVVFIVYFQLEPVKNYFLNVQTE